MSTKKRLAPMHYLIDAPVAETGWIGDAAVGDPLPRGVADQDVPTLNQIFALLIQLADLLSDLP